MARPRLVIGNKNYSSWSLRGWLVLVKAGIDFEEVPISLFAEGYQEEIRRYSPAGRVPVYVEDDLVIWDSLAIAETIAESHPRLWPEPAGERAHARAIAAEMHSGFGELRDAMPMNCRATGRRVAPTEQLTADIGRVQEIWTECRSRHAEAGPWLFGAFSIADAMYAPVAFRFNTYGVTGGAEVEQYKRTVLEDADVVRWLEAARNEADVIEHEEVGRV